MAMMQNSSVEDCGDVELMFPADRFPVIAGPVLRSTGWRGGTFVAYATGDADFTVEVSDGNTAAGFLLFQSENYSLAPPYGNGPGSPQNFLSQQFRVPPGGNNVLTLIEGGTRAYFKVFETVAVNPGTGQRDGGNGNLSYSLNDNLKISENGLLCNDSDANLATVGIASPIVIGIVSAVPSSTNSSRLGVDMKF